MLHNLMRRGRPAAFALGAALLSASARSQVTYTYSFPQIPPTIVAQWDGSTAPTGGDPTFDAPLISYNDDPLNSILPPTALISGVGQSQTLYRFQNFTVANPGVYTVTLKGTLTNNSALQGIIYRNSFNPASPLTNVVQQIPGVSTGTPRVVSVNLAAGNYVLVVTGGNNGAAGAFTATLTQISTPFYNATGTTLPPGSSPQFNRPVANGNLPPVTAAYGSNYSYQSDAFTVPSDGAYQIYSDQTSPNLYQGQISLYQNSFNPATPLENCLLVSGYSTLFGSPKGSSRLIANLKAGTQYYLVTSNLANGVNVANNYTNTINPLTTAPLDSWSGTTVGAPTFNRPGQPAAGVNSLTPTALSGVNAVYDAHTFTATADGTVTVTSTCAAPASWNNYVVIYEGVFDPSHPLTNVLYAADGGYNSVVTPTSYITQGQFNSVVAITFGASAGHAYTIVTTGNTTTSAGSYTGSVTQAQAPDAGTAVATLSGSLTPGSGGNTFQKPYQAATATTAPTQVSATLIPYSSDPITITTEGDYTIVDSATVPAFWGLYFILYKDAFDYTHPLNNIYQDPNSKVYAILGSDNQKAALAVHLTTGTYYAVTSGFGSLAYGDYTLSVQQNVANATPVLYSNTLNAGTGTLFTRPLVGTPPTGFSTSTTAKSDYYDAKTFTVPTTGAYNIDVVSNPTGRDIYGKWDDFVVLYQGAFDPASLTNAIASNDTIHLFGPDAGLRNVNLTAGTTYTLVTTGSSYSQFGSYHASVYSGGGDYPPAIPDNNATGLSATNTISDTFTALGLNSVTITGLYHPHAGDLLATLSHGGVTIELIDRVGRATTTTTGSSALLFGDYTFAPGGSDLGAAATAATSGGIDATLPYAPYLNGTPGQSSTLTGDFAAFNGKSVSGPWTLTVADRNPVYVGYFSGFSFNVTPSTAAVTGNIALEGVNDLSAVSPYAPLGTFHLSFRAPGATTELRGYDVALNPTVGSAFGSFSLPNIPTGTYDVLIKGKKNLAVLQSNVVVSGTSVLLADATLPAGDANNDNFCDTSDFGLLVGAYGADGSVTGSGYDPAEDFNFDGFVDTSDFGLLVGNYGAQGAI